MSYIIGGYLRIGNFKYNKTIIFFGFLSFIMTLGLEIVCDKLAVENKKYFWITFQEQFSLGTFSLYGIISGIGLILLVKDINFYSKRINFIASSTFGIYLIHANKNIAPFIFNAWFQTNDYNQDYFFMKYFLKAIFIFFICLFIDIIRRFTFGILVNKLLNFFYNYFRKK